jgi:predicted nucleic acid-binding protein
VFSPTPQFLRFRYQAAHTLENLGDVMIAATALHNGVALLTDSSKDFPMKELRLYSLPN